MAIITFRDDHCNLNQLINIIILIIIITIANRYHRHAFLDPVSLINFSHSPISSSSSALLPTLEFDLHCSCTSTQRNVQSHSYLNLSILPLSPRHRYFYPYKLKLQFLFNRISQYFSQQISLKKPVNVGFNLVNIKVSSFLFDDTPNHLELMFGPKVQMS